MKRTEFDLTKRTDASLLSKQSGLSLIEVILSMAVLATSAAVLGQLLDAARLGALRSASETEALIHAESILAEIVALQTAPTAVTEQPWGENVGWTYDIVTEATDWNTLTQVTVTARHRNTADRVDAEVSLTRWLYVPVEAETTSSESSF